MMNCSSSTLDNYLFTTTENIDTLMDFIEMAAALIKEKKIVLLFTRKHVDFMPILAGVSKEHMKNLILSYHSDVDGIIQKLLELHDWTIYPDLVVLDLNSFFGVAEEVPPFEKVCFCISALLSYMRSLEKIRQGQEVNQVAASKRAFQELEAIRSKILC